MCVASKFVSYHIWPILVGLENYLFFAWRKNALHNLQYCLYLFIFEFEGFFSFVINNFDLVIEDCKSPFVIHIILYRFKYLLCIVFF